MEAFRIFFGHKVHPFAVQATTETIKYLLHDDLLRLCQGLKGSPSPSFLESPCLELSCQYLVPIVSSWDKSVTLEAQALQHQTVQKSFLQEPLLLLSRMIRVNYQVHFGSLVCQSAVNFISKA